MKGLSAKHKIFILLAFWLGLSSAMFLFFFNFIDDSNQANLSAMFQEKKDLIVLKAERESYVQAQADLKRLAKELHQPEDFFSQDITLVNEILALEDWAERLNVKMQLSGVSGTITTAPKAKTTTPLGVIAYGINLSGSLEQVIDFLKVLENLDFLTNVSTISLSSGAEGQVNANLSANFYLKK